MSQLAGLRGHRRRDSRRLQGCLYTDVAKTTIYWQFPSSRDHFLRRFLQAVRIILLVGGYSDQIFHVEIFSLVDESNTKFARHVACCA